VPDAYVGRFLTNVEHFEPVEWTAIAVDDRLRQSRPVGNGPQS